MKNIYLINTSDFQSALENKTKLNPLNRFIQRWLNYTALSHITLTATTANGDASNCIRGFILVRQAPDRRGKGHQQFISTILDPLLLIPRSFHV